MEIAKFFTEEERSRIEAVQRQLFAMAADVGPLSGPGTGSCCRRRSRG